MTTHQLCFAITQTADIIIAVWVFTGMTLQVNRLHGKTPNKYIRTTYRILRRIFFFLVFISVGSSAYGQNNTIIGNGFYAGWCCYLWWKYRNEDDDDWWKKTREKLTEQVKSLGHRLVLVPAEDNA